MGIFEEYINTDLPIKKELIKIFSTESPLTFFDIGACECEDSIRYSRLFRNSTIYSFEPLPENFKKCIHNIENFGSNRIIAHQIALSLNNGLSTFYVSSGNPVNANISEWDNGNKSSSLYPPDPSYKKYPWLNFNSKITVETITIQTFCQQHSINNIDFIHMDVQGSELNILKGAGNLLAKIKAIWMEVETISMYKGQPLKNEIEEFMRESNFFKVIDTAYCDSGDQLYLNSLFFSKYRLFIMQNRFMNYLRFCYSKFITILLHFK